MTAAEYLNVSGAALLVELEALRAQAAAVEALLREWDALPTGMPDYAHAESLRLALRRVDALRTWYTAAGSP